MSDQGFHVDEGLRKLIPPLSADEREQLEQNLERDGCREPLVVWAEKNILLDGHNRLFVCRKLKLTFNTERISLPDRNAAKRWIIGNQLGRRNLEAFTRAELALQLEPLIAQAAKDNQRLGGKGSQKSANLKIDTRQELATVAGISHDTIAKAKVIAEQATEEIKEELRSGETTINAVFQDIRSQENNANGKPSPKKIHVVTGAKMPASTTIKNCQTNDPEMKTTILSSEVNSALATVANQMWPADCDYQKLIEILAYWTTTMATRDKKRMVQTG